MSTTDLPSGVSRQAVVDLTLAVGRLNIACQSLRRSLLSARLREAALARGDTAAVAGLDSEGEKAMNEAQAQLDLSWDSLESLLKRLGDTNIA